MVSNSLLQLWFCGFLATFCLGTIAGSQNQTKSLLDLAIERSGQNLNSRVIGGSPATIAKNPWQVALVYSGSANNLTAQFCGGSIVAQYWVLTAAHCIDQSKPASFIAVLSGTDSLASGGVRSPVAAYRVHERFVKQADDSYDFDIALLKMEPTGPPLRGTSILGLSASTENIAVGTTVHITGWGATERTMQPTIILQYADTHYVDTTTICNAKKSYDGKINENMLCAGEKNGGIDTCQSDSGGPASVLSGTVYHLVGISSWGYGCGDPDMYGVYTRVSTFREWIKQKTNSEVNW